QRYPTAPRGLVYPGDPGVPDGLIPTIHTNFLPRVGIVYDPFGNGRTAIRAGYGIFTATAYANITSDWQVPPLTANIVLPDAPNLVNPWGNYPGGSPFPYTPNSRNAIFPALAQFYTASPNWGTPYVQQYNFTVQQQIGGSMNLQVAYVGNTSRKLY